MNLQLADLRTKTKTWVWKCEWKDRHGDLDGCTYSICPLVMNNEIRRRIKACNHTASRPQIIVVPMALYKLVKDSRGQFYSTVLGDHPLEKEIEVETSN